MEAQTNLSTQDEVGQKKRKKNSKIIEFGALIVFLIIFLAFILDIYLAYQVTPSIEVNPKRIESFKPITPQEYELEFILTMINPTDQNVQVEKVNYNIYLDFQPIGKGEESSFEIQPGENDYWFKSIINTEGLSKYIQDQMSKSDITLKIDGIITIPIKIIRSVKIGEIHREYELMEDVKAVEC